MRTAIAYLQHEKATDVSQQRIAISHRHRHSKEGIALNIDDLRI